MGRWVVGEGSYIQINKHQQNVIRVKAEYGFNTVR